MKIERTILIDNLPVPTFLYGTAWKELDTQRCVREALRAGFRGLDTANQRKHYHEVGVGDAIREAYDSGLVTRTDLFLQTKFTHLDGQDHRLPYDPKAGIQTQVMQSFASSLEHLHTNYLDSYVLHGASILPGLAEEDWQVWSAMEEIHQSGKAKILGLSNVVLDQIQLICKHGRVKPRFVQNRCYAIKMWDKEVREFCNQNGILYQGFSLLTANRAVFQHPLFREMLARYRCTPAQLVFAFALHSKMIPLTGTTNRDHIREDLLSYDIELDPKDVTLFENMLG